MRQTQDGLAGWNVGYAGAGKRLITELSSGDGCPVPSSSL